MTFEELIPGIFYDSLKDAEKYIQEEFYDKYCGRQEVPTVYCVGHTHIDVAWLWTLGVTRDKAVRSFTTVLELMKNYPEYIFMSSQPQLYEYVKENAPEIYEEIRAKIREGRWEAEGGMWLEADCNISSGEALVRQFLYGTRFFEKEFGVKNRILWLPDVFGYSAALPQIMKKSGIDYFMTTKISWNERNKMPYDTFMWEGIDGTEVLTHFIPTRDYGAKAQEDGTETAAFYDVQWLSESVSGHGCMAALQPERTEPGSTYELRLWRWWRRCQQRYAGESVDDLPRESRDARRRNHVRHYSSLRSLKNMSKAKKN